MTPHNSSAVEQVNSDAVAQAIYFPTSPANIPAMDEGKPKKSRKTATSEVESAALRQLWDTAKASGKIEGTQAEFAVKFDIGKGQAAVSNCLNGQMELSIRAAKGFARGLGVEVREFSPRLARIIEASAPWPFEKVAVEEWEALDPDKKREIEERILGALAIQRKRGQESGGLPGSSLNGDPGKRAA
jgi:hypothetical protein